MFLIFTANITSFQKNYLPFLEYKTEFPSNFTRGAASILLICFRDFDSAWRSKVQQFTHCFVTI